MNGSWFLGVVGTEALQKNARKVESQIADIRVIVDTASFRLYAAPASSTCVVKDTGPEKVVLCGSAFDVSGRSPFLIRSETDLESSHLGIPSHASVLGQYAAVMFAESAIDLFCDPNGLRSIFIREHDNGLVFSTHLHLITRVSGSANIDVEAFGSHWMCHNQLRRGIFLEGISRICGADRFRINTSRTPYRTAFISAGEGESVVAASGGDATGEAVGTVSIANEMGAASTGDEVGAATAREAAGRRGSPGKDSQKNRGAYGSSMLHSCDPVNQLSRLITQPGETSKMLALSGGLDSRMLAGLFRQQQLPERAFAFGNVGDADVRVAVRVADSLNISLEIVENRELEDCVRSGIMGDFARDTWCVSPITAVQHLGNYSQLFERNPRRILFDGGFGEIGRGAYYRRFALLRQIARFKHVSVERYLDSLAFSRCDVFADDIRQEMNKGAKRDVQRLLKQLDAIEQPRGDIQRGNIWLGATMRRQNFFGLAQSWIDGFGPSMMPYAQQPFIQCMLQNRRASEISYKQWLRRNTPELAEIGLAKNGRIFSFYTPRAVQIVLGKLTSNQSEGPSLLGSPTLKEMLYDAVSSVDFRSHRLYDHRKASELLDGYYGGDRKLESQVAWFASLELWRSRNRIG